jgi:perosamine synthetase
VNRRVDPNAVLRALREVLPETGQPVPLHEPEFRGHEWQYVKECIDTGWVSSVGEFVDRFETLLCEAIGVRHAIAAVNGTAALHLCARLAGIQPGDEVLVPSLTFVATANAVSYAGAVPHFVDSEPATLGVDPGKLDAYLAENAELRATSCRNRRTGATIRAMIPVHTFGHPFDVEGVRRVAERYRITMIEDAAESLGSTYRGHSTGRFGRLAALSFNGNKIVTTGGGGAVLTDDPDLAAQAKHLSTTARTSQPRAFGHDQIGYNYRMPNLNAALGCAQLERLPDFVRRKRLLAERYAAALRGVEGVTFVAEPEHCRSNYWLSPILVDGGPSARDSVLETLNAAGLMARPCWTLMHELPMYRGCPRMDLSGSAAIASSLISLPSSPALVD